ncbi:hypothetical protein X975_05853, partial [Stegodyphus mimosarum]
MDEIIRKRENTLKILNSQIDSQLNDAKEFEKDVSASDKYYEQIMSAKFRIKIRLNKCNTNENLSVKNASDANSLNTSVSEINLSSLAMELPKLNIPKFSGDAGKCPSQRLYIQKRLSKQLGLKVVEREEIMIHTFGSQVPTKQNCARLEVKRKSIFDSQELIIEILETDEISNAELDYPPENIKEL